MSNKPIDMFKIRQILRLYSEGKGTKFISRVTGVARNTVKKYLLVFADRQLSMEQIDGMSDGKLSRIFLPEKVPVVDHREDQLQFLLAGYAKRLSKRGMNRQLLYEEYCRLYPAGFKRTAFVERLNAFMGMAKPSMHIEHKAGDKLFIDFTGRKLYVVDEATAEARPVEVFVAVLGCSQYTFVMAVASQNKEDFIYACEKALHFYGGVPQAIVPDNLKSAINKASKYEAELNESFAAFAEHYKTFVYPARVYKPKDKALVEGAVKLIYSSIFTRIDERSYHSLEDLNHDISRYLNDHNNARLTGQQHCRRSQFEELEQGSLKPLNPYRFEPVTVQRATVNKYGHVLLSVDKRYYSVPYKLIGKRLKIKYSHTKVEVYDADEVVAVHERYRGAGKFVTLSDHMASQHKYLGDWNEQKFLSEAAVIGEEVKAFIASVLASKQYPEQSYKSCSGILSFAKRVGAARLINACRRADRFGVYNYRIIDQILKSRADFIPLEEPPASPMPEHPNIRGGDYYR